MNTSNPHTLIRREVLRFLGQGLIGPAAVALTLLIASSVLAGPVVSPGGKPGAAASWSANGNTVTLKIASGYDPKEVASAISKNVKGASAKAEGDKVVVTGMAEAQLLSALEKVDVKESSGDDVDKMLASLQGAGGDEEGSGSSIRATKAADFSEVLGKKEELITAKVVEVRHAQFPLVFVTVKLTHIPKGAAPDGLKSGAKITVLPRVKSKNGVVDPQDETSKLNLGGWYAEPGDTVLLRLENERTKADIDQDGKGDDVWVAAAFDRKVK